MAVRRLVSAIAEYRPSRESQAGIGPVVVAIGILVGGLVAGVLTGMIWGPINDLAQNMAKIADGVVEGLPVADDLGLDVASGWVKGYSMLNTFLPVSEALAFALIFVSVKLAILGYRLAIVVWHLIPKPGMGT